MKKIGFFGGTFDPIHFGHINLALCLMELHRLDEVLFSPAYISPHKVQSPPVASPQMRLEMTARAIGAIPQFSLYPQEVERGGSSFTVDTIKDLIGRSKDKYYLLLGEDALPALHRWKGINELLTLASPLIASRKERALLPTSATLSPSLIKTIEEGWTEIPMLDISSTTIRNRLKKELYCGHLLPPEVLDFISENEYYLK